MIGSDLHRELAAFADETLVHDPLCGATVGAAALRAHSPR